MNERPTSVTVFAVINLILAGLGVLGFIFWLLTLLELIPTSTEGNPAAALMENSEGYQLFTHFASVMGLLATILIMSASIGMFSLKPWARPATIGWGVYSILMTVVASAVNYLIIFGPLLEDLNGPERIGIVVAVVFTVVIGAVFIGYFLLMIFMLTRPRVVEAFIPLNLETDRDIMDIPTSPGGDRL
jgi:hypothetical protein